MLENRSKFILDSKGSNSKSKQEIIENNTRLQKQYSLQIIIAKEEKKKSKDRKEKLLGLNNTIYAEFAKKYKSEQEQIMMLGVNLAAFHSNATARVNWFFNIG